MATQREIIYNIRGIIRANHLTDDDKLPDRQLIFMVDAARATILRQQYNKGQTVSENNIQYIPCLEMEVVDSSFMEGVESGCSVLRTVLEIPTPIEGKNKDLITSVSAPKFGVPSIDIISYNRAPYYLSSQFATSAAVLYNGRIYIMNSGYLPMITVGGVWEKPSELENYNSCEDQGPCFTMDSPYPASSHMIDIITRMVVEELSISLKVNVDKTNSGNEEMESQGKNGTAGN